MVGNGICNVVSNRFCRSMKIYTTPTLTRSVRVNTCFFISNIFGGFITAPYFFARYKHMPPPLAGLVNTRDTCCYLRSTSILDHCRYRLTVSRFYSVFSFLSEAFSVPETFSRCTGRVSKKTKTIIFAVGLVRENISNSLSPCIAPETTFFFLHFCLFPPGHLNNTLISSKRIRQRRPCNYQRTTTGTVMCCYV